MLVNKIEIQENRIVAILDENKKSIIKLDDYYILDKTIKEELYKTLKEKSYSEEKKQKKIEELFKMVNLSINYLERKINTLSESEIIKYYFAQKLLDNSNIIVIEDFTKILDNKNRNKILKILLKLKKYYNKTIFIYSQDLNYIFEIIDDVIYIKDKDIIYNNKYDIFKDCPLYKPNIYIFIEKLKNKYPSIKYTDSINELIKDIYRNLR